MVLTMFTMFWSVMNEVPGARRTICYDLTLKHFFSQFST